MSTFQRSANHFQCFSHDVPLRFLNLYAGERLGWVVHTLKSFLEDLRREIGKKDAILLYDIACQLHPYVKLRKPELLERLSFCVNKFHRYAHEYRCQELYGQHQTKGVGQSDSEGTERVWALLRCLVVAGYVVLLKNALSYLALIALKPDFFNFQSN